MVAMNVLYATGARDETPDCTGLAHLFEHCFFGGSANVDDFDGTLTAAGGTNNAWTSNDFTAFWDVAPAHNAETLFYLESDRMRCPALGERTVDVQKSVVIEEFKQQCLNRPYGRTAHHLRRMLYPASHPYSWPVIGKEPGHVAEATADELRGIFMRNYSPANAVLAVSGAITLEQTIEWARKWFGDIPSRPRPARDFVPVTPLAENLRTEIRDNVPATVVTLAWLMDPYGTEGYAAADALTDILAAGNASRFYRRLIADGPGWLTEADASISGSEHEGFLMVNARLADESIDVDEVEHLLLDQLRLTYTTDPIGERELQRVVNKQKSLFALGNLDCLSQAQTIAMAAVHGENPDAQLRRYQGLTPVKMTACAEAIFSKPYVRLVTRPQQSPSQS